MGWRAMANSSDQKTPDVATRIMERMVRMPPKQHKDMKLGKHKAKAADKKSTLEIIFDTDSFDDELRRLGALAFKNFLETRGSVCLDLSFDIFVSKSVPAGTAGTSGQVFVGLRIIGGIKKDVVA
jgi:hypothetical protein